MARLGDICTIQSGGTPSREKLEYWTNGSIPWIKISDIKNKNIEESQEFITDLGLENSSAKIFPKGTILYTIFATLGDVGILNIDAATNQAIAGLQIIDEKVLCDYLYYYLISKKSYIENIGRGVAQNNINLKILRDFESLESFKKGNIVYKELLDDLGLDYESLCKAAVIKSFLSKEIEKSFSKDIAESLKSEYPQIYKKIKEVCDAADDFNTDFTEMVKILRNMNFSIYKSSEENFITTNVPVYCTFKDETLVGDNESSLKSLCFPISPNLYVFYCSEKLLRRNRTIEMSKKDVHDINMQFCELPCDIVRFFISKDKKTLEKICKD